MDKGNTFLDLDEEKKHKLDENYIYGRWGPYQTIQAVLVYILLWASGFQLLIGVFIAYRPEYECAATNHVNQSLLNDSYFIKDEKCQIKIFQNATNGLVLKSVEQCTSGFKYSLDKQSTIVTEFDLICDRANLAELLQTLIMAGQLVGSACTSSLSDRVGRKTVHLGCNLLTLILGISVAFSPNYTMLAALKFILGLLLQGMMLPGAVFTIELFPEDTRFWCELFGALFWTTGLCIMSAIAYLMQSYSWRYLQIALSCFSLLSLIQYKFQDESLRWLMVNGKTKEVDRVLHKVAKWNKLDYLELRRNVMKKMEVFNEEKLDVEESLLELKYESLTVEKYSIFTILRNKSVLLISLLMCFAWMTDSLTYFSLTLTSTSLAGNRFLNFFLSACMEYLSLVIEYPMLRRYGRRTASIVFHSMAGIFLAIATVLNHVAGGNESITLLSVIATFIGKMWSTGGYSVVYLFTPELFPTNLRNVGLGLCSTISKIGAMITPFVGTLAAHIPWAPGTIFSIMSFVVALTTLYLPETRGIDLPSTLGEVKVWYAENSGFRLRKGREKSKQKSKSCVVSDEEETT